MAVLVLDTAGQWEDITGLVDATDYVLQNIGNQKIEIREGTGDTQGFVRRAEEFFQISFVTGEAWQARVLANTSKLKYAEGSIT